MAGDGLALVAIALFATVIAYAAALFRRSWSLWLVAFTLTVLSLGIAWWVSRGPLRAVVTLLAEIPVR